MAKMLLGEDDRMVRKLLRDVLAEEGHDVVATETYEAGSRFLHQGNSTWWRCRRVAHCSLT